MTPDDVVKDFDAYLKYFNHDRQQKSFAGRLKSNPESCLAEAIAFNIGRVLGWETSLNEHPGKGGPDFLCLRGCPEAFLLEVAVIEKATIASKTGMPDGPGFGRYDNQTGIGPIVFRKAGQKYRQIEKAGRSEELPVVLALFLNHSDAEKMLVRFGISDIALSPAFVPIEDGRLDYDRPFVDLKRSLFYCSDDGSPSLRRTALSAVLLIVPDSFGVKTTVLLHPGAERPIDEAIFAQIPIVRLVRVSEEPLQFELTHSSDNDFAQITFQPHWRAPAR
jgi:hypothetical protein